MQSNLSWFILLLKSESWYCHTEREMRFRGEKQVCWMLKGTFPSISHHCVQEEVSFIVQQFAVFCWSFFFFLTWSCKKFNVALQAVSCKGAKMCTISCSVYSLCIESHGCFRYFFSLRNKVLKIMLFWYYFCICSWQI